MDRRVGVSVFAVAKLGNLSLSLVVVLALSPCVQMTVSGSEPTEISSNTPKSFWTAMGLPEQQAYIHFFCHDLD